MTQLRTETDGLSETSLLAASVRIAHTLQATVVIEGVETEEDLQVAHGVGAEAAQGYYLSPPQELAELIKSLSPGIDQQPRAEDT